MTLFNPHDLRNHLPAAHSVLGLDPGSKQIGVALSDTALMLASPLTVLMRQKMKQMVPVFQELCKKHEIGALVVGLPLSLDGSFGPAARAASDWANDLSERLNLPACLWDERLSSSAVNRFLVQEADMTRKRRGEVVDKMAAAYMLQGWIDATAP
ncbi:Holliday junction resolvase RuvX [Bombella sp. TMW 2.2543]|uniref:Putative pre-16S rRNA nuclease n=1 Tax=Bombella pluederhausensis TaxID=2967336 RepID=A0ABT3WIH1_9PROT|nr:Holliday junction resolvase RuvX [Bombella pluederhausensis]MCX5617612.1 Holliday junction resolvase RuvX [Bombella pluederhausensis]